MKDGEGVFKGKDADEVWLDGFMSEQAHGGTERGRPANSPDYSWPAFKDRVRSYSMYKKIWV